IYVRKVYQGIDYWIYGLIIEAIAFNLFLFGHAQENTIAYYIANIFFAVGLLLFYFETNKFIGHTPKYLDILIAFGLTMIVLVIFYLGLNISWVRQMMMSLYISYIMSRLLITLNLYYCKESAGYLLPFMIVSYGLILSQLIRIPLIMFG